MFCSLTRLLKLDLESSGSSRVAGRGMPQEPPCNPSQVLGPCSLLGPTSARKASTSPPHSPCPLCMRKPHGVKRNYILLHSPHHLPLSQTVRGVPHWERQKEEAAKVLSCPIEILVHPRKMETLGVPPPPSQLHFRLGSKALRGLIFIHRQEASPSDQGPFSTRTASDLQRRL